MDRKKFPFGLPPGYQGLVPSEDATMSSGISDVEMKPPPRQQPDVEMRPSPVVPPVVPPVVSPVVPPVAVPVPVDSQPQSGVKGRDPFAYLDIGRPEPVAPPVPAPPVPAPPVPAPVPVPVDSKQKKGKADVSEGEGALPTEIKLLSLPQPDFSANPPAPPGKDTVIFIPESSLRIIESAQEEIGGFLSFQKIIVNGSPVLKLDMVEAIAGVASSVNPNRLIYLHALAKTEKWILFHTHPPQKPPESYNGYSGADFGWFINNMLAFPGDIPKLNHILFTTKNIHVTMTNPRAYKGYRNMLKKWRRANPQINDNAITQHYRRGCRALYDLIVWFSIEYSKDIGDYPDFQITYYQDYIKFVPEDIFTAFAIKFMIEDPTMSITTGNIRTPETKIFLDWFIKEVYKNFPQPKEDLLKEINSREPQYFDESVSGLFYTWVSGFDTFVTKSKREDGDEIRTGQITLHGDKGRFFNDYKPREYKILNYDEYLKQAFSSELKGGSSEEENYTSEEQFEHMKGGEAGSEEATDLTKAMLELEKKELENSLVYQTGNYLGDTQKGGTQAVDPTTIKKTDQSLGLDDLLKEINSEKAPVVPETPSPAQAPIGGSRTRRKSAWRKTNVSRNTKRVM